MSTAKALDPANQLDVLVNDPFCQHRILKLHGHRSAVRYRHEPQLEFVKDHLHFLRLVPIGQDVGIKRFHGTVTHLSRFTEGLDKILLPSATSVRCYADVET